MNRNIAPNNRLFFNESEYKLFYSGEASNPRSKVWNFSKRSTIILIFTYSNMLMQRETPPQDPRLQSVANLQFGSSQHPSSNITCSCSKKSFLTM